MTALIYAGGFAAFLAVYALLAVYAERKVAAFIQDRLGPMEVGPKGIFQTAADILKLLQKETIIPLAADKPLFLAAPVAIFAAIFAGFAVLPPGPGFIGAALDVGALYLLAIVAVDIVGLLMAGWASNNKYALIGSVRAAAQMAAYEAPAGLALLAAAAMYGTLRLDEVSTLQGIYAAKPVFFLGAWDVGQIGGIAAWGAVRYPHLALGFGLFFISSLAEANRAPFDLPEAESELIGGFHTEYSGFGFAVMFLAEYANMFLLSALAVVLFFGGWNTPLPNLTPLEAAPGQLSLGEQFSNLQLARLTSGSPGAASGLLWGFFWLATKTLVLVWAQMWARWTLPRLRADQLMRLCWMYLLPGGFLLLAISACWKLAEVYAQ